MAVLKNLQQENEALQKRLAELEAANKKAIKLKVSTKGALSFYGVGRFPVTLYQGQWTTILDHAEQIREFIAANQRTLSSKDD